MDCLKCDDDDKNTKKSVEQLNNIRDVDNTSQNDRHKLKYVTQYS